MERIFNRKQMKAVLGCFFICLFTFSLFSKTNNFSLSFLENNSTCQILDISNRTSINTLYIEKTQSCAFQPKSSVKSSNLHLSFFLLNLKIKIKQPDYILISALEISYPTITKFLLTTIQNATLF